MGQPAALFYVLQAAIEMVSVQIYGEYDWTISVVAFS